MGVEPGQALRIETEQGPMEVTVPDGVEPGDTFEAEIVVDESAHAADP